MERPDRPRFLRAWKVFPSRYETDLVFMPVPPETVESQPHAVGLLPGPELRLLSLCAHVSLTDEERRLVEDLTQQPLDWSLLLNLASRHRCLPLLNRQLNAVCRDAVPAEIVQMMQEKCQEIAIHNLTLAADLIAVLRSFEREGIEAIPYKGPVLAQRAFGDVALREFDDLDILVRSRDLARSQQILLAAGYEPYHHDQLSSFFEENSCHYLFGHPQHGFQIELHWAVASSYFPLGFKRQRIWQGLERIPFGGLSVLAHKIEDLVLVLCIHGGKHHWKRLSWIVDVAELIRRSPDLDWDLLLSEAARLHCRRIVMLGVQLAGEILGAPVPARINEQIAREPEILRLATEVWEGITLPEEVSWAGLKNVAFICRVRERWRDRIVYVVRRTITPTEFELNSQPLPRPLHILYFPLRLLRMTFQYGGVLTKRMLAGNRE
jgi:hypothetical protein